MTQPIPASSGGESLASIRGFLLHLAEQHLGGDLHAKGGASDLVQSALLDAHRHRDQFRGTSDDQYKGWLRQILLNAARKFRRRWRGPTRATAREVSIDAQPALRHDPAHCETPSYLARQQERRQRLAEAVASLPHDQRQVVVWRVEEDVSFPEIGARLGKSADAARMLFNRALEQLQRLLPAELSEGGGEP